MKTEIEIERLWVFALAAKCTAFSPENIACMFLIVSLTWLLISLIYWPIISGPRGLPLIGSMSLIASATQSLSATVIVMCHPDVAREILNSSVFTDSPVKESAYSLMFNRAIGFAPNGVYWRTLRCISAAHLFSPKQIKAAEAQMKATICWKIRFICSNLVPKLNRFISRIISEHRTGLKSEKDENAPKFVDVLISLQGTDKLSDTDMIAILWEMIFRGTDTVAVLIEWILAWMVLHPVVQSTIHDELDKVLVYLTAVVKEVLRMHPPGPLLSWARVAITDTMIDGYHVPAGTTTMVNMWTISRDPEFWPDPLQFKPERFVPQEGEHEFLVFGSDLRLALFGSGRQTCPGKVMGLTTVTFWVASLLHKYEWQSSNGNTVELSEVLRLSCEMASPLVAKVRPRRSRVTIAH
ncbi:unnamed protein product [Malus baccata var. baccata]